MQYTCVCVTSFPDTHTIPVCVTSFPDALHASSNMCIHMSGLIISEIFEVYTNESYSWSIIRCYQRNKYRLEYEQEWSKLLIPLTHLCIMG